MNPIECVSTGQVWDSALLDPRILPAQVTLSWDPHYPIEVSITVGDDNTPVWHIPADVLSRYLSDPGKALKSVKGADWAAGVQNGLAVFAFKPDCPPVYVTCQSVDALCFISNVMCTIAANWDEVQDIVSAALLAELEGILDEC